MILLVAHIAQIYLGDTGIYLSSIVAGTTDVDAITLSMAELANTPGSGVELDTAALAIVLAITSNVIVKGVIVMASGAAALRRAMLPGFVLMVLAAIGVALLVV